MNKWKYFTQISFEIIKRLNKLFTARVSVMRTICCRIYSMHSPYDRRRTYSLATRCYSLYTIPGLKGQNNSAQGKVSGGTNRNVALGKGYRGKTVRGNSMNKANNSLRTPACRWQGIAEPHFREIWDPHFRPKHEFHFYKCHRADDFSARHKPRALPWAIICCPFRASKRRNKYDIILVILLFYENLNYFYQSKINDRILRCKDKC